MICYKSCRYTRAFVILLLTCFIPRVHAQTVIQLEELQYKKKLPYQQPFYIEGPRQFLNDQAVAGELTIKQGADAEEKFYWWNTDDKSAKFRFLVTKELEYQANCKLTFKFYQLTTASASLKKEISDRVQMALIKLRKNTGAINDTNVIAAIETIANDVNKDSYSLKFEGGVITAVKASPDKAKVDGILIASFINNQVTLDQNSTELSALLGKIAEFKSTYWLTLKTDLPNKINGKTIITPQDEDAISNFINSQSTVPIATIANIENAVRELNKIGATDYKERLLKMLNFERTFERVKEEIARNTSLVEVEKKGYSTMFDALMTNVYMLLGPEIILTAIPDIDDVKANEVDKTRWSVIVGAGVAGINDKLTFKHIQYSPNAYLAFKYYLGHVDKTVSRPYLDNNEKNKWSLQAGWRTTGDLRFEGSTMDRVLGIRPFIGVGRDLVRLSKSKKVKENYTGKIFTVSLLFNFFSQPNKNPFDTDAKFNVAPTIGLSIDLDLINRLKSLLSGSSYSLDDATK
jgi:hypothetical protein